MCEYVYECVRMCVVFVHICTVMCVHVCMYAMHVDWKPTQCWQCSHGESNCCSQKYFAPRWTQDETAIQFHHLAITAHDIGTCSAEE